MLQVLQSRQHIDNARQQMITRNISVVESLVGKIARKLYLSRHLPVGDVIKSWDVLASIEAIEQRHTKDSRILDIGAYCSEVPVSLSLLNYKQVHAIDLNPEIKHMPHNDTVAYAVGNFMQTQYPDAHFDVLTAISVIEHGYQPEQLFAEVSRLLKPGGDFIASFDYWPEKINTGNTKFFGMSWLIFSRQDVQHMLEIASHYGLEPTGTLSFDANERPIHCLGFDYTFAWLNLRKKS
jgi:SAM-dependent methyltransferase